MRLITYTVALGSLALLTHLGGPPSRAHAQEACQPESTCRFKKPNVLFVLDYSSSMVGFRDDPAWFPPGQDVTTRWTASLDAVIEGATGGASTGEAPVPQAPQTLPLILQRDVRGAPKGMSRALEFRL